MKAFQINRQIRTISPRLITYLCNVLCFCWTPTWCSYMENCLDKLGENWRWAICARHTLRFTLFAPRKIYAKIMHTFTTNSNNNNNNNIRIERTLEHKCFITTHTSNTNYHHQVSFWRIPSTITVVLLTYNHTNDMICCIRNRKTAELKFSVLTWPIASTYRHVIVGCVGMTMENDGRCS